MSKLDDEIDRLYQLPLSEFTKARDALAKQFEKDKASIKSLQKPNVAAWAVNQLYWRERGKYDTLVAASSKVRATQVASLKGKSADVAAAEARYTATRKTALDRIRDILTRAGEALSPATITAVNETLQALPTDDPPGRLVRPLKPMGFEGLAGMLKGGKIALRQAEIVPFKKRTANAEPRAKKATEQKEIQKLAASLRTARNAERDALAAQARARKASDAAKTRRDRAVEELDAATDHLGVATSALAEAERVATLATGQREAAERQLERAKVPEQ